VCWRYEFRDGDWTKIPCNPRTGANAKSNDPSTWTSFDDAIRHASQFDGIGFQFGDSGYVGIDLDDCRDPTTGTLSSFAQQILRRFDSYAEVSPSGAGVKVFLRGNWKDTGKHKRIGKDRIEVYPRLRYFTVTGAKLSEAPNAIKDCQSELDALHTELFAPRNPSSNSRNGDGHASQKPTGHNRARVIELARKYVAKMDPAISGEGGHDRAFHTACTLVLGFGLSVDEALPVIAEWNVSCQPPWSERDLLHKLNDADKRPDPRGMLVTTTQNKGRHSVAAGALLGAVTNGTPTKGGFISAPMPEIISRINSATDKWPRASGGALFVHEQETGIAWIGDAASMFGYIGSKAGHPPKFHRDPGAHSKAEVFAEFRRLAMSYGSVEVLPHEPPLPDSYYACEFPPVGNGDALRTLVNRFCPATPIDSDLILAFLVTSFWGGRGGSRPVFAITSDHGRGTGKSTAVAVNGRLGGGVIELSMNENPEVIKQRLLSPDGITKRIACLDNAKTSRFSWADLESLVTSPIISGKRLYVGEASRPNYLVWALTLNGISLATDMAQRSVIIKLGRPQHCATWAEDTYQFVDENRRALIGDCLGFLRSERRPLPGYSRWGAWEHDVLSRLPEPAEASKVIIERQGVSDCEREEAEVVEEFIRGQLAELQYTPGADRVFIPSTVTGEWFNQATNERHSTIAASRWLNQQIDEGKLSSLTTNRCKTYGRGFVWIGEEAGPDAPVKTDLEARLATKRRPT
jgi:hypothetical protein